MTGRTNIKYSRNRRSNSRLVSKLVAIILVVIGFLMFQPFFWTFFVGSAHLHYMTLSAFIMLICFLIGLPMFIYGIINLVSSNTYSYDNQSNLDISRIRYTVETDKMNRK